LVDVGKNTVPQEVQHCDNSQQVNGHDVVKLTNLHNMKKKYVESGSPHKSELYVIHPYIFSYSHWLTKENYK